ncbi:MAG TPA: hypothetical protein VLW50_14110 [Streptosporangiaceae bacterium]|nr:hypothetical protein [Streptosporangiaceae bacterium]
MCGTHYGDGTGEKEDKAGDGLDARNGAAGDADAVEVAPTEGVDVGVGVEAVLDDGVGVALGLVDCADDVGVGECGCGVDVALLPTGTFPQTTELDGFPAAILITVTAIITVTSITPAAAASIRQLGRRGPCGAAALPSRALPSCLLPVGPPRCSPGAGVASFAAAGPPSHQALSCPGVGLDCAADWSGAAAWLARRPALDPR